MDEDLRQSIEVAREQQPVAIDLKWYQGTADLDEIKQYIRANINSASRSFVAIGYYLKYVRDKELFTDDGYQSIWEFALAEFGISKPQASKFMSINDKFSVDGNSPILLEQFKDFSSSKLQEMLYLTDEQLEHVAITTTIAEIREIKNPEKTVSTSKQEVATEVVAPAQQELKSPHGYEKTVYPPGSLLESKGCGNKYNCFSCSRICRIRQENRYCVEAPMGNPFSCTTMNILDSIDNDIGGDCMFINLELAYHRAGDHEPSPCCKECKNKCGYACNKAVHRLKVDDIPEIVNAKPEIVDNEPEIVNDVDDQPESDDLVLDCFNQEEVWHKEIIRSEPDPVETVEADIIQTLSTATKLPNTPLPSHLELAKEMLKHKQERLNEFIRVQSDTYADRKYIESRKVEVAALTAYISEEDRIQEPIEPVQPELPILKNNDQRAAFIEAYETWPIWIDLKETGERYYRYDLTDKIAMVVKVSWKHAYAGYRETRDYEYGAEQYYLIGVKSEWSATRSQYIEDASRTFYECSANKTALVEYLKEFQKKGR